MDRDLEKLQKECFAKENESIKEHTDKLIRCSKILNDLGYISEKEYESLKKSCLYHDIGKINPKFQERIKIFKEGRKKNFDSNIEVPHNILSYFLLDPEILENYEDNYLVIYSIINHHKKGDNFKYIGENEEIIEENLDNLSKKYGIGYEYNDDYIDILDEIKDLVRDNKEKADIQLGLLNKCDYAASADIVIEYPSDFLNESLENMMKLWQQKNPNNKWNTMQEYCYKNKDKNLIVIGSTGSGKTEAALRWIGNNKGFFVLPLKTAINAMYSRIKNEILDNKDIEKKLGLLHGDTLDIYINTSNNNIYKQDELMNYYDSTKMYSLPLNVSTPDQLFNFIFKSKGYELKYAMLSYSKTIIDEIQAYSPDILASIIYGIHKIIKVGGKISIFTATLPPFVEDFLNTVIEDGKEKNVKIFEKRIDDTVQDEKNNIRHKISVREKELTAEEITNHYKTNRTEFKKYLVVCNTVKKAQEIYSILKEEGYENIHLLHSKFTKKDRAEKESKILSDGQTYDENGQVKKSNVIWISTQIVEASLDIDFDYIFTELSDINALFQRMGRINRKGKKQVNEVNCFVYTEINTKLLHKINQKTGFIDAGIYNLSKEALLEFTKGKEKLITEKDKYNLINQYLTVENLQENNSAFLSEYKSCYKRLSMLNNYDIEIKDKFRNIISYDIFPVDEVEGLINEQEIKKLQKDLEELRKNPKDEKYFIKFSEIKRKIKLYTVSVGLFDIKAGETGQEFKIGNNEIKYLACKYDSEIGYQRTYKETLSKENKEEIENDSFI